MPSDQLILTIHNRHSAKCGEPPQLSNADRSRYFGYFQSEHGDQWLFIYDLASGVATLRCGDADWSTVYTVHGPKDLPDHMLESERAWGMACWQAALFWGQAVKAWRRDAGGTDRSTASPTPRA